MQRQSWNWPITEIRILYITQKAYTRAYAFYFYCYKSSMPAISRKLINKLLYMLAFVVELKIY